MTTAIRPAPAPAHDVRREPRTRREWVTLAVGVLVLVALCLVAGRWQWNRYVEREEQIAAIEANYTADAVPLTDVLPGPGAVLDPDDVWRPVTVDGRYEPDATVLLRNRPVGSQAGFHVLVPLVVDEPGSPGLVVVVNRGFVPLGTDASSPDVVPAPPEGVVEVTMTLRADEPPSDRDAPPGQVQAISTAQVLAAAGVEDAAWATGATVGAYGALRSEDPAPATALRTLPPPDTDPGSHLSYAFQWGVFAAGAVLGFLLLVRRDRRDAQGDEHGPVSVGDLLAAQAAASDESAGPTGAGGNRPRRDTRTRRPSAEEEEDALIDAQLR
ncbi:SURF1 family protein [Oerskovia flava]|uniref:SURF1 family cytochrome oxidase biogenesis protein n=1 Tax=Oerskovia flava TaxID=2986422 RepID=UPI002240094C|nr:SURF1 family protein [Oerskovia sp. JB1-3-2]